MPQHYLIIGGGPAATNAMESIRQADSEAKVTLVSDEPAHSRMALPYWLSGQIPREQTYTADEPYFAQLGIDAKIGNKVTQLDAGGKTVTLNDGQSLSFDKLLLATGSRPRDLPVDGADLPGVGHLWTLSDTEQVLRSAAQGKPRVVMIGAGFIGFIMLNAMHKKSWHLTVVEREEQVLPRMLDADGGRLVQRWLQDQGVQLRCGTSVSAIEGDGDRKQVVLDDGDKLDADLVVIAIGVQPNVELAKQAGLDVDQGILVDDHLRTSAGDVYAAGDVAQGPILMSDGRAIHAIQPTAVDHGRVAGANMAGADISYPGSLSMNVLDVCKLQCASFGQWDDTQAETTTILNESDSIYRSFKWDEDRLSGAMFLGRANDMGMMTDVGMIKGFIQTGTPLGPWKQFLQENPFDVRRAFVACKVPQRLAESTLLGRPAMDRKYRYGNPAARHQASTSHQLYVNAQRQSSQD